jgi:hypothetical protein
VDAHVIWELLDDNNYSSINYYEAMNFRIICGLLCDCYVMFIDIYDSKIYAAEIFLLHIFVDLQISHLSFVVPDVVTRNRGLRLALVATTFGSVILSKSTDTSSVMNSLPTLNLWGNASL